MEEVDEIFADPHPVKASLRKQKVIVSTDQSAAMTNEKLAVVGAGGGPNTFSNVN